MTMNVWKQRGVAALMSAIMVGGPAYAVNVPSSADPGKLLRSFGEDRPTPSRVETTVDAQPEREASASALDTKKTFTLRRLTLRGSTVYSQADVDAVVGSRMGQLASFADLNDIARELTARYRQDGYIFSSVSLPPQKVENGAVHMVALEGRVTDVKLVGSYRDANGLIRALADKIKSEGPSNAKDVERYLLLIDDLPGIKARSLMQPSKTPGGGELIITIEEDIVEGSVGVDNRGSDYVGPYRGTLVAAGNSLFGIHDRTTVRGVLSSSTEELRFLDLSHEEQIGTEGLRVKARGAFTSTEPGEELEALDIKGRSRIGDIEALYPMVRNRQYNVNLIGGFTALNSETDVAGVSTANDHVRYVRGGTRVDFTDRFSGVNQADIQVAKGLSVLGATKDGAGRSRSNGEHTFLRTNGSLVRVQDITNKVSVQVSASGQYSPDTLLSSEEFALGGSEFGRAYDSGEISGDKGVAGGLEVRYTTVPTGGLVKSAQYYSYYDAGKVWNKNISVGETKQESLASIGVGVRFNLVQDVSGYVELDTPISRNVSSEHDKGSRMFFNLLKRF